MAKYCVGVFGCGNWGTTIAKIIAENVIKLPNYKAEVLMWVYEEQVEGQNLSYVINNRHENIKYLPGIKLPSNLIAVADMEKVASECSHVIFVIPHQFVIHVCEKVAPFIKKDAIGLSLIKGLVDHETELIRVTQIIHNHLGIHVSMLAGANIASEIAAEKFSTSTIGCDNEIYGKQWFELINSSYFKVSLIPYVLPIELFSALKNCVALGIGFGDALGYGTNAKSSAIRIGFAEIIKFIRLFEPECSIDSFFESFGLDDLIATCFGGRNVRAAEFFIRTKKDLEEIEKDLLNGQKLQGPSTITTVYNILCARKQDQEFPFFLYIYNVLNGLTQASSLLDVLRIS